MLRRLTIVGTAAALLGCVLIVPVAGASAHKVYVERDIVGQELADHPHAIGLSADGTFALAGTHWESYGGPVATATARAYVGGCRLDCAEGTFYRPAAALRFSDKIRCRGVAIYSRLRYSRRGPRLPDCGAKAPSPCDHGAKRAAEFVKWPTA